MSSIGERIIAENSKYSTKCYFDEEIDDMIKDAM